MTLQKAGGLSALIEAVAYVVGFVAMATLLNPGDTESWSAAQKLSFVLEQKMLFQMVTIVIYVLTGVFLVVLAVALHERLKSDSAGLMQVATAFGLIWAGMVIASGMVAIVGLEAVAALHAKDATHATSVWGAVGVIQNGLGGGIEIVGGIWVLLISVASMQSRALPTALNYLGLTVGVAGTLTVVPGLAELAVLFGLGQILWFSWVGIVLLRRAPTDAVTRRRPG